jgi:hypothetical protein
MGAGDRLAPSLGIVREVKMSAEHKRQEPIPDFARGQETEDDEQEPRPDFARGERGSDEVTTDSEAGDFAEGQGEAHPKDVPQGDFARGADRETDRDEKNVPGG